MAVDGGDAAVNAITAALASVRAALLRQAHADAQRTRAEADTEAATTVTRARARAREILVAARVRGEADAAAMRAADRVLAQRAARAKILAARRATYEQFRRQAIDAVCQLRERSDYPAIRTELTARARVLLGSDTVVTEDPRGGIIARDAGRRLDYTLAEFAVRALDRLGAEVEGLWEP